MLNSACGLIAIAGVIATGSAFGQSLADQIMDADEKHFAVIFPKLKERAENELPVLIREIERQLAPDAKDEAKEKLAKRQANAAAALLRLNQHEKVWLLLKHSPDPRVRSYLIHRLGPLGIDPATILNRLDDEPDITIRRALLLSLGEYYPAALSLQKREDLLPKLKGFYRNENDPGIHAAAEWLLRRWQQQMWLKQINEEWAQDKEQQGKRLDRIESAFPRWYVNGQGQTMVVIPGPVEFIIGLPNAEAGGIKNERQQKKRIGRTFAVSAKPITLREFLQFDKNHSLPDAYARTPDLPVVKTSWYQAVEYCNWLNKEEGIPEDQWCFEIVGDETMLKKNYLSLIGYRLPTEAEMEYVTRAGATTSRHFGETDSMFSKYAWLANNSRGRIWPVGWLKPNDLGLFDVQGNVQTWCQESLQSDSDDNGKQQVLEDLEHDLKVDDRQSRVLHGGSFVIQPSSIRANYRFNALPKDDFTDIGFRLARTLPTSVAHKDRTPEK